MEVKEKTTAQAADAKKTGSKKRRAALILTLCILIVVVVLAGCAGYSYYRSKINLLQYSDGTLAAEGTIDDEEAREDDEDMKAATADLEEREAIAADGDVFSDSDVFNILLIGTDERTTYFNDNARGDSCMLFSINKKTMKVSLVSFERGTGVPILEGQYQGQWDWLTHTFRYGGADLMMKEIRECYKVDVTHYARANIYTFMQLIDSVGGVDIELTQAEADYINDPTGTYGAGHIREMGVGDQIQTVTVGMNHLNGATAMLYSRCRAIDNDWHRVERQRNVIESIMQASKNLSVLDLNAMLDNVLPNLQTNLTESEITSLLLLAPNAARITVEQMTIPVSGTYGSMIGMGGRSLFAVDFAQNAEILQKQLYEGAVE